METFLSAIAEAERHIADAQAKLVEARAVAQDWPAGAHAAADLGAEAERLLWSANSALFRGNKHGWVASAKAYDRQAGQ